MTIEQLQRNIDEVRANLKRAARGFDYEVELCAVTKTVDEDIINMAAECGISVIGENRVQEACRKFPALNPHLRLHIIGQLQTNKVKYIIEHAAMIQSLDRIELAAQIDRQARRIGKVMPVLVQVNIAEEEQKSGVSELELMDLLHACSDLQGLSVRGLMAIMPFVEDPETIRPYFRRMRALFDQVRALNISNITMECLSMGMSGDYIIAAEEGATMVRVGSSIFGSR